MSIDLAQIRVLPQTNHITIPEDFLDEMGHMNIMYYIHIYDRAAWGLFNLCGITLEDFEKTQSGMFALKQVINYLAEVHMGETVAVHSRVLGLSAKRLHFMHYMVNETTDKLASTFEVLASHADLTTRRTSPFPEEGREKIKALLQKHTALGWESQVSGIIQP